MKKLSILALLLFLLLPLQANPFRGEVSLVIIDAGHGGKDPGALGGDVREKDIVLAVAKELENQLRGYVDVILTRDDDTFLELQERSDTANSQSFDLSGYPIFISLHVNAAENPSASGFEIFIKQKVRKLTLLSPATSASLISKYSSYTNSQVNDYINTVNSYLAAKLEASISKSFPLMKDRGVKEGDLWILNQTFMPACLIELGFITNDDEREKLTDPAWQKKMATAIAAAVKAL